MKANTIKSLTKIGMVGCLSALVLPQCYERTHRHARCRNETLGLHVWAGIALVGFAVWHYNCYQPPVWMEHRP